MVKSILPKMQVIIVQWAYFQAASLNPHRRYVNADGHALRSRLSGSWGPVTYLVALEKLFAFVKRW
jgi:hypothetical protein